MKRTLAATALVIGLAGCSNATPLQTVEPATPVAASSVVAPPAGELLPVRGMISQLFYEQETHGLLSVIDGTVELSDKVKFKDVSGISAGNRGEVLIANGNSIDRVNLKTLDVRTYTADDKVLSGAVLPDGRVAIGTAKGEVLVVDRDEIQARISGLASVDALAISNDSLIALDRRQNKVVKIDVKDEKLGESVSVGKGAGRMAVDNHGHAYVTDVRGKALIVLTTKPLTVQNTVPLTSAPWAVAVDSQRNFVWVTLTESNVVAVFDTDTLHERRRYATVHQPNSLAIDESNGEVFIGSDALQRLKP